MSLSGASASAAAKQRHQEQRRADTSALVDAARGQRQMPELPPYVPEFDLAFMSQMLGVGAVRSEPEDPATGDIRQIRVFLVVLSLAPLATSRSVARPWPVPRVSVRRVVPSNSGRRARMRSASGGTKPREFCTPRCTAGLTESGSSRLLLLPQQQSAAALIRKLMTSSTAGGIRAATAGVRLCTATCPRLRTMCARIG